MDFMMIDQPNRQNAMRGGLAWLDAESQRRVATTFVACTDAERRAVLDDISWPRRQIKPGMSDGVTFFNSCRDLTDQPVLFQPDGHGGPRVHGQHGRARVGRLPT